MSVVAGQARRRWLAVAVGVAVICSLPVVISALPVGAGRTVNAAQLRARILAAANLPYQGYVESAGALGVPNLRALSDVTAMLDGTTRMRVWQAAPSTWRVDVLSDVGEHDTYQLPGRTYVWDSGSQLLSEVTGSPPVRLPRGADLLPPALALRLLRDGGGTSRMTSLPAQRIAGRDAPGLRLVPTDPETTIGHVDIWADAATGLPLKVEITGRAAGRVVLTSRFLQVSFTRPAPQVLTPRHGAPGSGFTVTSPADISKAIGNVDDEQLPDTLAGRPRVPAPSGFQEIGIYGTGLSAFAVVALRGGTGAGGLHGARTNGGSPLTFPTGTGALIATPLITVALVHPYASFDTFIVAGLVSPRLLSQAAAQLSTRRDSDLRMLPPGPATFQPAQQVVVPGLSRP